MLSRGLGDTGGWCSKMTSVRGHAPGSGQRLSQQSGGTVYPNAKYDAERDAS
jgi:hypothetical protein